MMHRAPMELRSPIIGEDCLLCSGIVRGTITHVLSATDRFYRVQVPTKDGHVMVNVRWWSSLRSAWIEMPAEGDADTAAVNKEPFTTLQRDRMRHLYATTMAGALNRLRAHARLLRDDIVTGLNDARFWYVAGTVALFLLACIVSARR